jgi:antitoxin component HigA of HigAB toxin-antitoxin module
MVIRDEADYASALKVERLLEQEPLQETLASDRLLDLSEAIEDYEAVHWPITRTRL